MLRCEWRKGWDRSETLSHVHQRCNSKLGSIHLLTSRDRFWKDFGSVDNFCKHLQEEVEASLKEEVAEQMFEEAQEERRRESERARERAGA